MENARRTLIDTYLLEAADYGYNENTYSEENNTLSIYPEYHVSRTTIRGDLELFGSIDYVAAKRAENDCVALHDGNSSAVSPLFCSITHEWMFDRPSKNDPIFWVIYLDSAPRASRYHDTGYYASEIINATNTIIGILIDWINGKEAEQTGKGRTQSAA
ncbi:unnamed protein product, partial [Didymodactylos carnosus]